MQIRPLAVPGAWEATPRQFVDERGVFLEWFTAASFTGTAGHRFDLAQANVSVSARGVLRGIHVADVPPGQAKYVTCVAGAVLDVVVDLRVGSPTFGAWDSTVLDAVDRRAVYLVRGSRATRSSRSRTARRSSTCAASRTPRRASTRSTRSTRRSASPGRRTSSRCCRRRTPPPPPWPRPPSAVSCPPGRRARTTSPACAPDEPGARERRCSAGRLTRETPPRRRLG